MNTLRKNAAISRYSSFDGSPEELRSALQSDEKAYTEDEVNEIITALTPESGDPGDEHPPPVEKPKSAPAENVTIHSNPNELKTFFKYKIKAKYKNIVLSGGRREEMLEGYEKVGECLQETIIEQQHADSLNLQAPNSMVYYFQEGQPDLIPAENVH